MNKDPYWAATQVHSYDVRDLIKAFVTVMLAFSFVFLFICFAAWRFDGMIPRVVLGLLGSAYLPNLVFWAIDVSQRTKYPWLNPYWFTYECSYGTSTAGLVIVNIGVIVAYAVIVGTLVSLDVNWVIARILIMSCIITYMPNLVTLWRSIK